MSLLDEYIKQGLQLGNAVSILYEVERALILKDRTPRKKREALDALRARIYDFLQILKREATNMNDDEYVSERKTLIPIAVAIANKAHGATCLGGSIADREAWAASWNRTYHSAMNKLWNERVKTGGLS
jgi:hypothetical protein